MATTINYTIRLDSPRRDGTFPIRVRITHNRKTKYLPTPWFVSRTQIDKRGNISDHRIGDYVHDLVQDLRRVVDALGVRVNNMTIDEILDYISAEEKRNQSFALDFVQYTRDYASGLKDGGHDGTAKTYVTAINSLVNFSKMEVIEISRLTTKLIQQWIDWIPKQQSPHSRGFSRAPSMYFACLRAMFNRAKREFNDDDMGIIRISTNPFAKVDVPKPKQTRKRALSIRQIQMIFAASRPDTWDNKRFNLARDIFLLSFMLIGINAADLYDVPATAFDGERLTYKRKKTRTRRADEAEISIKVEPEALQLIDKYRDQSGERLFIFHRLYSTPGTFNAALNKGLKQIGVILGIDALEFYAARHSWATIALNNAGTDKYTVHEALNHIDPTMRVTDIYIKRDWRNIDRANRAVLDLIF